MLRVSSYFSFSPSSTRPRNVHLVMSSPFQRPCLTSASHELVRLHVQAHVAIIILYYSAKLNPQTSHKESDRRNLALLFPP
ncbi:hypothetical protein VYU27_009478 [Nannochloropsis oceanica]